MSRVTIDIHTQLTSDGVSTEPVNMGKIQPASAEFLVEVTDVDTNVVLVPEYSNDNFDTVVAKGQAVTLTADGIFTIPASVNYEFSRLYALSESGGTAVTIDVTTVMFY